MAVSNVENLTGPYLLKINKNGTSTTAELFFEILIFNNFRAFYFFSSLSLYWPQPISHFIRHDDGLKGGNSVFAFLSVCFDLQTHFLACRLIMT